MNETLSDYPALQMEDDGFLLSMKYDFVSRSRELFGVSDDLSFPQAIAQLIANNSEQTDIGSQLPLYIPIYTDDGKEVLWEAVPVWSGAHIWFPLYPGLAKKSTEKFIYGYKSMSRSLGEEFMSCDPAFKLALLVHYALDNILIDELAIEAFLLGRYKEFAPHDKHFKETGLPETMLASVRSCAGTERRCAMMPNGNLCISYGRQKIEGWQIMLMYGKEASNRKQEIDRQHYTIPNQRPKDKHCGKI